MGAVAGIYHLQHDKLEPGLGRQMIDALRRFPADYVTSWSNGSLFLGSLQQCITPQSISEVLPYYDPVTSLAITSDAIIDNQDELADQLQLSKQARQTITDSQLILQAYMKWGHDMPKHLIGDFAFIIWDGRDRTMFGARDFSGTRTLYFHQSPELFSFCTIMEPLLKLPHVTRDLNEHWISQFLAIPITTDAVDSFSTVYQSIKQLPPSHSIFVANGKVVFRQYCRLQHTEKLVLTSNEEYEEAFRDVFQTAVQARLRTFRQVGAHLSGGLDSGSVVSFAAPMLKANNKPLYTFSYYPVEGFSDFTSCNRFADEREYIRSTAEHVGNIEMNVSSYPSSNPYSVIDEWLDTLEMPYKFFENSFWLKGIYEQAAARDIGVMLTGQRGNWTISWGPAMDYQASLLRKGRLVSFFWEHRRYCQSLGANPWKVLQIVGKKSFPWLAPLIAPGGDPALPVLINPDFARKTNVTDCMKACGMDVWGSSTQNAYDIRKDHFNQLYFWNINGTIGTKLSLKHKIWDRDPTNDLRVVRFCLSVPDEQFVQQGVDRSLIRRATARYLPDKVRLNRKRRGVQGADGVFRLMPDWSGLIRDLEQMIGDPRTSYYLNAPLLQELLDDIRHRPRPELAFDLKFRVLMRGFIFHKFLSRISGKEV